jgi:dihydroorotase
MIDPHVHLRDWKQSHKETLAHGMRAAALAGIDRVFDMPNTDPPLTSRERIERRLTDARTSMETLELPMTYGLYAGLTEDPHQRDEVIDAFRELFPSVIGFKLFAGHSTGHMGIISGEQQLEVYRQLAQRGYTGLLAVHCEKEDLLRPDLWDPHRPQTHCDARPVSAETASVRDQLQFARESGFAGTLHICHVSSPETILIVEQTRAAGGLPCTVTCGVTPHHALLARESVSHEGNLVKMNPPLRDAAAQQQLFAMLLAGRVDWIESDHAPHTIADKQAGASGIPGFSGYDRLVQALIAQGISPELLHRLTGGRFAEVTGLPACHGSIDQHLLAQGMELSAAMYPYDPWAAQISSR